MILVAEGQVVPLFYMPVRMRYDTLKTECYLFFLVPAVLFYYILFDVACCVLRDCRSWFRLVRENKLK